jgi:hypothetical protein
LRILLLHHSLDIFSIYLLRRGIVLLVLVKDYSVRGSFIYKINLLVVLEQLRTATHTVNLHKLLASSLGSFFWVVIVDIGPRINTMLAVVL